MEVKVQKFSMGYSAYGETQGREVVAAAAVAVSASVSLFFCFSLTPPPKKNNGSLCIPGYPRASSVDQAGLKFKRAACLCFLSAVTKVCGTTTHYCWLK